jgi:hypothetical protein
VASTIEGGAHVPKVSRESASQGGDHGPVVDRPEDLRGYTVNFLTFREEVDHTRLFGGCRATSASAPTGAT